MTDTAMIRRMAEAIAASLDLPCWQDALPAARATLAAMREPTFGMLDAAAGGLPDWGSLPEDWRIMVDHAASQAAQ